MSKMSNRKIRVGVGASIAGAHVGASVAVESTVETRERVVNDAPKLHEVFEVGDVAHQGDVILVRIAALPKSAKPRTNRQLADGATQGSRHILERGDVFDARTDEVASMIKNANGATVEREYIGPVFISPTCPTADDLTHPEHGNQGFPAGSVMAVVYQRNQDAEERAARVAD